MTPFLVLTVIAEDRVFTTPAGNLDRVVRFLPIFKGRKIQGGIIIQGPGECSRCTGRPQQWRSRQARKRHCRSGKAVFACIIVGDEGLNCLSEPARNKRSLLGFVQIRPKSGAGIDHLPEATEHYSRHHAQENQRNQDFDEREARLFMTEYHRCVGALSYRMIKIYKKIGWEAEQPARTRALLPIHQ